MRPYPFWMRHHVLVTLLVTASAALAASPAAAQTVNAPPGLSGVDEYLETVPGAAGAERPGRRSLDDPKVAARAREVLGARTVGALKRSGEDGRRVAELAAAGAPPRRSRGGSAPAARLAEPAGSSPPGGVAKVLTGDAGAGWILPAGLIAATIILAAAGMRLRRVT